MKRLSLNQVKTTGILLLVAFLLGCGPTAPTMVSCTGTVKLKGQPCDGALVVFHPQEGDRVNDAKPYATTGPDGSYTLTTFELNDGAREGNYGITVVWNVPDKEAKFSLGGEGADVSDKLQGRYGNPRAPQLSATVKADQANVFDFDLK